MIRYDGYYGSKDFINYFGKDSSSGFGIILQFCPNNEVWLTRTANSKGISNYSLSFGLYKIDYFSKRTFESGDWITIFNSSQKWWWKGKFKTNRNEISFHLYTKPDHYGTTSKSFFWGFVKYDCLISNNKMGW